jgi:peptidoglycan/LPS O-acetylase OafA/YrhL
VLGWIGARSYAIYLWHVVAMSELYPLVRGIEGYRVAFVVLYPLVLIASAVLAELSWRLVEAPALRLRSRRRGPEQSLPPAHAPVPVGASAP